MEIIELENKEKWGQQRLHSPETWPGADKATRQFLAAQVVDTFHKKVAVVELNIQWVLRVPQLVCKPINGVIQTGEMAELEAWLEESYGEVAELLPAVGK